MIDEVDYVGTAPLPTEGYLAPRRYRVTCRCLRCEQEYFWETEKLTRRDKPCPNPVCKEAIRLEKSAREAKNFHGILENGPPAMIGNNNTVKAVDFTAETVMKSYNMTDLRDGIRPGESMAPKLPKPMQDAADGFFGGSNANPAQQKRFQDLGRRAIAGQFRNNAVNPNQALGRKAGESALTHVGTERI